MKIKIPKDSRHPEYDLTIPVLTACDYDNEKYNCTAITVAVGKSCKNLFEFGKERDRLISDLFDRMCARKVKFSFIPDFDPKYLSIDESKSIVYDDGTNRYDLARVCNNKVAFVTSPNKKHITINYDNGSYIASNFDNKWYVIMIDEFVGNHIICGALDMDTTTIEDMISFMEFETGWPHYRNLMEDR